MRRGTTCASVIVWLKVVTKMRNGTERLWNVPFRSATKLRNLFQCAEGGFSACDHLYSAFIIGETISVPSFRISLF